MCSVLKLEVLHTVYHVFVCFYIFKTRSEQFVYMYTYIIRQENIQEGKTRYVTSLRNNFLSFSLYKSCNSVQITERGIRTRGVGIMFREGEVKTVAGAGERLKVKRSVENTAGGSVGV